jgi:hypothetical protein
MLHEFLESEMYPEQVESFFKFAGNLKLGAIIYIKRIKNILDYNISR